MTELILIGWLAGVSVFTAVTVDSENTELVQQAQDEALVEKAEAMNQSTEEVAAFDAELDGDSVAQNKE